VRNYNRRGNQRRRLKEFDNWNVERFLWIDGFFCFDKPRDAADYRYMNRPDAKTTIGALVALAAADVPAEVDALVDAYLIGQDPEHFYCRRSELAHEFLNAAPFTELSYRIWRRIAGENGDEHAEPQSVSVTPSERFLPPVEFSLSRYAA
jgi:hypothetical protein